MSRQRINQVTVVLLVLGLGSALILALEVPPEEPSPLGDPMDSNKYLHDMKAIGGEANVLSAEFQDWFAGLWHGPALARTVAVLTIGVTLAFRFVAAPPRSVTAPAKEKPSPPGSN
jgi:multisubunit Na+/H+ antiporter MnhB subunit